MAIAGSSPSMTDSCSSSSSGVLVVPSSSQENAFDFLAFSLSFLFFRAAANSLMTGSESFDIDGSSGSEKAGWVNIGSSTVATPRPSKGSGVLAVPSSSQANAFLTSLPLPNPSISYTPTLLEVALPASRVETSRGSPMIGTLSLSGVWDGTSSSQVENLAFLDFSLTLAHSGKPSKSWATTSRWASVGIPGAVDATSFCSLPISGKALDSGVGESKTSSQASFLPFSALCFSFLLNGGICAEAP